MGTQDRVCRRCKGTSFNTTQNDKLECDRCGIIVGDVEWNENAIPRSEAWH